LTALSILEARIHPTEQRERFEMQVRIFEGCRGVPDDINRSREEQMERWQKEKEREREREREGEKEWRDRLTHARENIFLLPAVSAATDDHGRQVRRSRNTWLLRGQRREQLRSFGERRQLPVALHLWHFFETR